MGSDYNWGQAGQGAVGGAMAGASIGSVIPGVGTAIGGAAGGLIGGAMGLFSPKNDYEERLRKLAAGYGNRQAPQTGPAAQGGYSDFRRNQAGLIAQLEAMARGEGPSAAAIQMREAMDRAAGAQASAAAGAGGRGVNAGAALRNAMNNTAAIQQQGARDTATLRAQEQFNATGMLGQAVAQGRAADESMNQFNAGAQNDVARANLEAKLRAMGINTDAELQATLSAMGAHGPGIGTQLLGAGASAVPGALAYHQGQQTRQDNLNMQQQYMDYLNQNRQNQQMRQQMQATPSTPNSGWGYSQPQQPGPSFNFNQQQQLPAWAYNLYNGGGILPG